MNNAFLQEYLKEHYWDITTPFDATSRTEKTQSKIALIQSQINKYDQNRWAKDSALFIIDQEIQNKQKQISSLKIFIEQKSKIVSLQASLGKLQEQLEQLEKDSSALEESKIPIIEEINQINVSMKALEDKKSERAASLAPDFQEQVRSYIDIKKHQMIELFLANEQRREKQRTVLWTQFEAETKEQYPFENFQNNPEVLEGLYTMFDDEKKGYIETFMEFFRVEHANALINNFQSLIQNYEATTPEEPPVPRIEDIELQVNYKELDFMYKDVLEGNRQFFPHLKDINQILSHPLFARKWDVSFDQIQKYSTSITKKSEALKFNNLNTILNTLIFDYNVPISKISPKVADNKTQEEWDAIVREHGLNGPYAKDILINKDALKSLHKIVNLFNEKKIISFQWFEHIVTTVDSILKAIDKQDSVSLYTKLTTISTTRIDELDDVVSAIMELVEKNNIGKDVAQQLMMFQNIIWTIYGYIRTTYLDKNIDISKILNPFMYYILEIMYVEVFAKNMLDDEEHKRQLFSLYNDIADMKNYTLTTDQELQLLKKNFKKCSKLSTPEDTNARVISLSYVLKQLTHFVVTKNIYDISNTLFLDNTISEWDRKACADLYTLSPGFKAPSIDPILISPDKFGIKDTEYMLESYDLSDSDNYLAYVRMFNIVDFKNYEKMKKTIFSIWPSITEDKKLNIILNILTNKDEDVIVNWTVLPQFTPLFIHKNFAISLDGINSEWLKYIVGDKQYEMMRTYIYYTFMEANREHEYIVTTPSELISPALPKPKSVEEGIKIITINPDMPRTNITPKHTGITKNFEYKRECMVMLNPRCTTGFSGFTEAKNHGKELYAYVHPKNAYPGRDNCIAKLRLDTCENYEAFLEAFENFKKIHSSTPDVVVRVETYRSEFEKYEWAKEHIIYKIGKTKNAPKKVLWEKAKK